MEQLNFYLGKWKTGSGERGAGSGKQARGAGKMKNGNKLRIGNEVTDRARVQVWFRLHFHFPVLRARSSFPILITSSRTTRK